MRQLTLKEIRNDKILHSFNYCQRIRGLLLGNFPCRPENYSTNYHFAEVPKNIIVVMSQ